MLWTGVGAVTLAGVAAGAWILSLPLPRHARPQAIPEDESNALVSGLKPPKRQRPVVAIVGINDDLRDRNPGMHYVADAWSRTYRSRALTFSGSAVPTETRNGLRVLPDRVAAGWSATHALPSVGSRRPAEALDAALAGIAERYGSRTADFVRMQLEYPYLD